MRQGELLAEDVRGDKEGGGDGARGREVVSKAVCESGVGGKGAGDGVVEHAIWVGDVDVERVVPASGAEVGEDYVEPAVGVVTVHGVDAHGEVGGDIMIVEGYGRGKAEDDLLLWRCRTRGLYRFMMGNEKRQYDKPFSS